MVARKWTGNKRGERYEDRGKNDTINAEVCMSSERSENHDGEKGSRTIGIEIFE